MGIGRPKCLTCPKMKMNKSYHSESRLVPTLTSTSVLLKTFEILEHLGVLIGSI